MREKFQKWLLVRNFDEAFYRPYKLIRSVEGYHGKVGEKGKFQAKVEGRFYGL